MKCFQNSTKILNPSPYRILLQQGLYITWDIIRPTRNKSKLSRPRIFGQLETIVHYLTDETAETTESIDVNKPLKLMKPIENSKRMKQSNCMHKNNEPIRPYRNYDYV